MAKSSGFELIVAIVNAGYSSVVMDAVSEVGARGGTVLHAHGTANKEAEAFFHISIQHEKDAVLLVVPSTIKDEALHAIYQKAGQSTDAQGIAFSMTVSDAVGLNFPQQTKEVKNEK